MNIDVKIDRVTISGTILKTFDVLFNSLEGTRWMVSGDDSFRLYRELENGTNELVAGLYTNPYQAASWRLDTSNHLEADDLEHIQRMISLMENPHFTRIDIAFDIVNGYKPVMKHKIYRFNASQSEFSISDNSSLEITGRGRSIETIYSGKRKSDKMIRYYNKLVEQKSRRKFVSEDIVSWERLELQLRGKKPLEWIECAEEMLSFFKMPNLQKIENAQDRAMIYALDNHLVEYQELSKGTRAKFRKLIKDNCGFDTEYAELCLKVLNKEKENLENELNDFLVLVNLK